MTEAPPPHRLLVEQASVERCVSHHLGRAWRMVALEDMHDRASHPAAILSDGAYAVFAKLGEEPDAPDQFAQEVAGLRFLAERSGALTPGVIGTIPIPGGVIMILEAIKPIARQAPQWRDIGRALALIHRAKWDRCGLTTHSYWGDLRQDNEPIADWPTFYRERRLRPRLRMAIDSGHVPASVVAQVEELISRLPNLCGPDVVPTLLHGDAHQNNFISTERGAVMIDPAVHYGHPELDLAYVDLFSAASDQIFEGYREIGSIDPGFAERRDLWLVSAWLALTARDASFLDKLTASVEKYL
jgi:fructosamine-3-kinase